MKFCLIIIIVSFTILNGQFSSGVDYSVKEVRTANLAGVGLILETAKTEWKINYGTSSSFTSFTAKSEVLSTGYEACTENNFENYSLNFNAKHLFTTLNNSATLDSSESITNYDPEGISFQKLKALAGIRYKDMLGISAKFTSFFNDDNSTFIFGAGADYKIKFSDKKNLNLIYEMNLTDFNKDITSYIFVNEPDPDKKFGLKYTAMTERSQLSFFINYLFYDMDMYHDIATDYMNVGISYKYDFISAGSSISASAGSYISSEFDLPKIRLPFFYYDLGYENTILKDKLVLLVGWDYELFNTDLRSRYEFAGYIPEGISSDEITETAGNSRLYVKLNFKY